MVWVAHLDPAEGGARWVPQTQVHSTSIGRAPTLFFCAFAHTLSALRCGQDVLPLIDEKRDPLKNTYLNLTGIVVLGWRGKKHVTEFMNQCTKASRSLPIAGKRAIHRITSFPAVSETKTPFFRSGKMGSCEPVSFMAFS